MISGEGKGSFIAEVWYIYRDQCSGRCLSLELGIVAVGTNCYCYVRFKIYDSGTCFYTEGEVIKL
jgi:hypothetical protein